MASLEVITELPRPARRAPDSNKGNYGKVLVVAGSRGMSGAAVLSGSGALRGGAGLVTVAVPEEILPIVASSNPCYLTAALPQDKEGKLVSSSQINELTQANDVAAVGPGLGRSAEVTKLEKILSGILSNFLITRGCPACPSQPAPGRWPSRWPALV